MIDPVLRLRLSCGGALLLGVCALPGAALGQAVPVVSQPVIQAVPGGDGLKLNDALAALGRDPRDVAALIDAGRASLDLGDTDAAIGFFQRAVSLAPQNAAAKAGLAGAHVQGGDPYTAISLFGEAELAGPLDAARLADRGLAYDMVGDNRTAQDYYRRSMALQPSDEAARRLALSQAIAGDRAGMETTLAALLQRQDRAAWRTRAFALAILGQTSDAESIARQSLPADKANAMNGYLRFMARLTPAQQAAAGNLGRFPRAAEIGIDDPRVAQFARPRPVQVAAATPATPPRRSARSRPRAETPAVVAPPPAAIAPAPVVAVVTPPPTPTPLPVPAAAAPPAARVAASELPPAAPGFATLAAVAPAAPTASAPVAPAAALPAPGFDLAQTTAPQPSPAAAPALPPVAASAPAPTPVAPPPAPAPAAPRATSLAEVFADFTAPSREAVPQAGAVDLRQLPAPAPAVRPSRESRAPVPVAPECEVAPPAKGKAGAKGAAAKTAAARGKAAPATQCKDGKPVRQPAHPSRIWVQVATGKDRKALAFDWRKLLKEEAEAFKGRKGSISAWGATNRLLTGPFDTEAAATAFVGKLKKAGVGGAFVWTSPAGQAVDSLP